MQTQAQISQERLKAKIGSQQTVLIDSITSEYVIGRSPADAPEIDGVVYIQPYAQPQVGTFVNVKVTAADDYDLYASFIKKTLCTGQKS